MSAPTWWTLGLLTAVFSISCAGASPSAGPSDRAPEVAGAPKHGGILRVPMANDPGLLDVHQATDSVSVNMLRPLSPQVIRTVPNVWTELEGDLATHWEPSSDGRVWTFTLRKDASWQDGTPITADDVAYSLHRIIQPPPGNKGGNTGCMRAMASGAAKVDDSRVSVTLKQPAVAFLQCVSMSYIRIQKKAILEPIDINENSRDLKQSELVAGGPFTFTSYQRGSSWVMKRNPNYYLKDRPYLDGVTYFIIPDENTQIASFQAGQLDLVAPRRAAQTKQLAADMRDRVKIRPVVSQGLEFLLFNLVPPFDDVRLRRAVHLAIDRQALIEFVHDGQGSISTPLGTFWDYIYDEKYYLTRPGYRPDKPADLQEAKRLVDEATGGKGLDVVFTHKTSSPAPEVVQLLRQQLAKVGIRVTLDGYPSPVAQQRYLNGQFQVIGNHSTSVPFDDPDSMMARHFLPNADRNWGKWRNKEFEELYAKESVMLDRAERAKLLRRMADILEEEVPQIGLTDEVTNIAMQGLQGIERPRWGNADLRWDWVWFDR